MLQSWLLAESTKGQRCVRVCMCGGRKEGVIIGHKPRHGNNTPHTLKTAHTQLETWARLSQIGWLPRTPERRAMHVCVCVVVTLFWFFANKKKERPTKTVEEARYGKRQRPKRIFYANKTEVICRKIQRIEQGCRAHTSISFLESLV